MSQFFPVTHGLAFTPPDEIYGNSRRGFLTIGTEGPQFLVAAEYSESFFLGSASRIQHVFMSALVDDWQCHSSFSVCFPDLDAVTKNRTRGSPQELSTSIDGEVASQSKEFEVLGIKFPREDLDRWGLILLCSILAYFCLHLRELSPNISAHDDGLTVAWLGLYSSWYAQSLVWLSLLLLPCGAVLLLGRRGAKYEFLWPTSDEDNHWTRLKHWLSSQHWDTLSIWIFLPLAICAVLGSLSCLSAMKLAQLADTARNSPEAESATDLRSMD